MEILCYAPSGFSGSVVSVEVDIRTGLPGIFLVGLPDGAVREAKERIRVAIRNSGYRFPYERIVINLAPAGVRKEGAAFDLPIALAILLASGQASAPSDGRILAMGELRLSGEIRSVRGVLPAVSAGIGAGVRRCIVPKANKHEAAAVAPGRIVAVRDLAGAAHALDLMAHGRIDDLRAHDSDSPQIECHAASVLGSVGEDFADIKGQEEAKRALVVAAAGRHHVVLFGPPGCGKTMAGRRLYSILPDLDDEEAVEVSQLLSLAGLFGAEEGLMRRPQVRTPHHSSSAEGLLGGGRSNVPGEAALAHRGVLFLDEASEFSRDLLQALREPVENGRIELARAGGRCYYPARFQLLLAVNPCPCGNLGRPDRVCACSLKEVRRYWRKFGAPLLDRIDIRVPLSPVDPSVILGPMGESSQDMREQVERAVDVQRHRFTGAGGGRNGDMIPSQIRQYCRLDADVESTFTEAIRFLRFSSRACHSVLKIARTIADVGGSDEIRKPHILEAAAHRRYGDEDFYWVHDG